MTRWSDTHERLPPQDEVYVPFGKILLKYIDRLNDEVPEDDWRKVVSEMLEEVKDVRT